MSRRPDPGAGAAGASGNWGAAGFTVALLTLLAALGALIAVPGPARGATGRHTLTIYAVATRAQFVDHADDRARGEIQNPFNADTKALAPASKAKEKGNGPFPGDDVLYAFKLYRSANLKHSVGSASYTCVYNFAQHALCEASFQLEDGALFASGPVDFTSVDFTLAVTGGSGRYLGARGQVAAGTAAAPTAKDEHRLEFILR